MSAKERRRAVILAGVNAGELNLVEASGVLGLGYRQTKRVWRRYQDEGDAELVHRLRGQPGQRRKPPELRAQILARWLAAVYWKAFHFRPLEVLSIRKAISAFKTRR